MNVREFCIYIRDYIGDVFCLKSIPFTIISIVVLILMIVMHLFRYRSLNKSSLRVWGLKVLLSMEIALLIVTMLVRNKIDTKFQWRLQPFASYAIVLETKSMGMLAQIILNILVYIPFGYLLPCCFSVLQKVRYIILITTLCSVGIECIQVLQGVGLFETDDILNNVFGAIIGMFIYRFTISKKERIMRKESKS